MNEEIKEVKDGVDEIVSLLQDEIDNIVNTYTNKLTELMEEIDDNVVYKLKNDEDLHMDTIKKYFIQLSECMYFVAPRVENLSLYDSISKIKLKEKYDDSYLNNDIIGADGKKPTATKLTALAESESKFESMVNEMYNKAYRIMKSRVDQAQTMVSTLSKLLSAQMSELNYSNTQSSNRILNEEVL